MKAIFASKLYKASPRKDRIQAALNSLGNIALVQQLASSLDEEYKTPENLGVVDQLDEGSEVDNELLVDEEIDPENDLVTLDDMADSMKKPSSHSSAPHSSAHPKGDFDNESEDKPKEDTSDLMPDSPATEQPSDNKESAEASTKVTAATDIKINPVPAAAIDLNVLKSTLNSREDIAGVSRIAEKENEIWIYYKDEVNLNNIMTNVIEMLMNSADYKNFTFNRLARSDNAIVFEVTLESYTYPEKSVESAEDK